MPKALLTVEVRASDDIMMARKRKDMRTLSNRGVSSDLRIPKTVKDNPRISKSLFMSEVAGSFEPCNSLSPCKSHFGGFSSPESTTDECNCGQHGKKRVGRQRLQVGRGGHSVTPNIERIMGAELLNADRDKKCVTAVGRTHCPQCANKGDRERSLREVSTWHC